VASQASLFFSLPNAKPRKLRSKKKKGGEQKEETVDTDFEKSLTVENIGTKISSSKGEKLNLCLGWIDKSAKKVFESKAVLSFSKETLKSILTRDSLGSIKEIDLFEALIRWGRAKTKEDTSEALKATIKDLLPLIRFPLMTSADLASKVVPTSLLTQTQILQLFTYVSTADRREKLGEKIDLGSDIKVFSSTKRKSAVKFLLRFDPTTARACSVLTDGKSVDRPSGYEASVRADKALEEETFFQVRCRSENSWSGSFMLGIMERTSEVNQTCFTSTAWYCDIWHSTLRSLSSTTEVPSLKGTTLQTGFNDQCEGRIMGLRFKASKGGGKGGGTLEFFLDGQPIDGAVIVIPDSYDYSNLIPWFGIYGRCRGIAVVEDES